MTDNPKMREYVLPNADIQCVPKNQADALAEALKKAVDYLPHIAASNYGEGRYECGSYCPACSARAALAGYEGAGE